MTTPGGYLPMPSAEGDFTSASQAGAFGLLDTVPALIWVSDERNAGIWFNRPWLEFTGRGLEQELGFGWTQAIHPDDRASAAGFCQAHFDRREPFLMKFRLRRHDGVYRWMLDHGVPRFSPEGALLGYVGSCVDITGQRETELAIAMHARVLDSMREGVCVADADGRIVYTNPAEDRMFGYAPGELAGRHITVLDAGAPEEHVRRAGDVAAQLRERGQWSGEWQNVRKDGTPLTTAVRITTLDLDGRTYRVWVQEDVTERNRNRDRKAFLDDSKRLLVASLAEESALRTLTRHCVPFLADSASVDLLTEDGEIQRVETAHIDPEKEAIVRDMWRRYPYRPTDPIGVPEVLRTGEPQTSFTIPRDAITRFARDAEHLELLKRLNARSYICVPLAARGQVYGALSLVLSESDRLYTHDDLDVAIELARRAGIAVDNARLYGQAQRARTLADEARAIAERASRSKSEFLATVSHEIRTPINAIIGYTQLLQLGVAGGLTDEQARQLARIGASGRHLLRLVEDILDLSKIEADRLSVDRDAVVAANAADAAIALIRPQAAAKGITLHDRCEGDRRASYIGDEQRVQQILANLLSNAVKFTPERGTVRVQCLQTEAAPAHLRSVAHDRWTCIAVSDSGTGIEPAMLESIFQPFVQGDAGYTRTYAGTGLGLTISRRLARLMDGDLTVESTPNSGSTFTLWLPAGAAVAEESTIRG